MDDLPHALRDLSDGLERTARRPDIAVLHRRASRRRHSRRVGAALAVVVTTAAVTTAVVQRGPETVVLVQRPGEQAPAAPGPASPSASRPAGPSTGPSAPGSLPDVAYPVPPGAVFVAPDGSDDGRGTESAPFRSVARAVAAARPGGTVVLRAGTYRSGAVPVRARLTLQPYPDEKVWFKGSRVVGGFRRADGGWRVTGWTQELRRPARDGQEVDPAYPLANRREMAFVDGVPLRQVASRDDLGAGTFFVDDDADELWLGEDPAGRTVEASTSSSALEIRRGDGSDPGGTLVRGLGFAHFADSPLRIGADRVTVERVTAEHNGIAGVTFEEAASPSDGAVRVSTLRFNGMVGLDAGRADGLRVEGNVLSDNNVEHFTSRSDAAGIKVTGSDGVVVRDNVVERNAAAGIWMSAGARGAVVARNRVAANAGPGIMAETSPGIVVAGNVVTSNVIGVLVRNARDTQVWANTIALNTLAVVVRRIDLEPDRAGTAAGATYDTSGVVVRDNLLAAPAGDPPEGVLSFYVHDWRVDKGAVTAALANNVFLRTARDRPSTLVRWSPGPDSLFVDHRTNAALRDATGQGADTADLVAALDVVFVDPARGDLRLRPGWSAPGWVGAPLPARVAGALGLPAAVPARPGAP